MRTLVYILERVRTPAITLECIRSLMYTYVTADTPDPQISTIGGRARRVIALRVLLVFPGTSSPNKLAIYDVAPSAVFILSQSRQRDNLFSTSAF